MNRFEQPEWTDPSLFLSVDESWMESAEGARFVICPLEKHESPILLPDTEWEGGGRALHQDPFLGHVLWDLEAEQFVLYYNSMNSMLGRTSDPAMGGGPAIVTPGGGSRICLATSKDGIHWEKPELGLVAFRGNRRNNMVPLPRDPLLSEHLSAVLPTRHEGAEFPLAASIYSEFADPVYPRGITGMTSPDGFHWNLHYPPTMPLDGDAHCVMWDGGTSSYLCTTRSAQHTRMYLRSLKRGLTGLNNRRHVALARSRDLVHWTPFLDILEADEKDPPNTELYQMYIIPYGNLYIGLLQMFYMGKGMTRGPLEIQLAVSRDLENWTRVGDRTQFIPRGEEGSWDCSHILPTNNPPFAEGDRLRFWYGGKNTEHWQFGNAALGTGTIRMDGFAKWETKESATLISKPFAMRWATWPTVNVDARNGSFSMEVVDAESGEPLPNMSREDFETISGDHLREICRFRGHFGTFWRHTGKVRIKMYLENASLYALRIPNLTLPEKP